MGLSKERWQYLKSMPGCSYARVPTTRYKWYDGHRMYKRPDYTYRGMRKNALREERKKVQRYIRKERWAIVMGREP